ncbi:MAG: hypothetical protein AAFY73_12235 [Pseudomonadota bacterium]
MDHIKDLKKLRDDALSRLQSNPDYRTLRALTALIDDLTLMDARPGVGDLPKADEKELEEELSSAGSANGKGPGRVTNYSASSSAPAN